MCAEGDYSGFSIGTAPNQREVNGVSKPNRAGLSSDMVVWAVSASNFNGIRTGMFAANMHAFSTLVSCLVYEKFSWAPYISRALVRSLPGGVVGKEISVERLGVRVIVCTRCRHKLDICAKPELSEKWPQLRRFVHCGQTREVEKSEYLPFISVVTFMLGDGVH
jgi:hypothetical protein